MLINHLFKTIMDKFKINENKKPCMDYTYINKTIF
jgi:hypothetical protein